MKDKQTNSDKDQAHCIKCCKEIPGYRDTFCPPCYEVIFNLSRYFCWKCKEIYPKRNTCPKCSVVLGTEKVIKVRKKISPLEITEIILKTGTIVMLNVMIIKDKFYLLIPVLVIIDLVLLANIYLMIVGEEK